MSQAALPFLPALYLELANGNQEGEGLVEVGVICALLGGCFALLPLSLV